MRAAYREHCSTQSIKRAARVWCSFASSGCKKFKSVRHPYGNICCAPTCMYLTAVMVPPQMYKLTLPQCLRPKYPLPYEHRCRNLVTIWMFFFPLHSSMSVYFRRDKRILTLIYWEPVQSSRPRVEQRQQHQITLPWSTLGHLQKQFGINVQTVTLFTS